MTRLIERAWVPMVTVIVLAVRAFTISRFQGVFGPHWSVPAFGTADLIVQFKPKGMICEVYGPVGRVVGAAFWSHRASDAGDRRAILSERCLGEGYSSYRRRRTSLDTVGVRGGVGRLGLDC